MSDLRLAFRRLTATPAFTAVVILTLALGVGVNTAVFSVIEAVLLRPLRYPAPERVVAVWEQTRMFGMHYSPPAMANYVDWRAENHSFEDMGASEGGHALLTTAGETREIRYETVTASLFRTLGVAPALGRIWSDNEDRPGAPKTVVLSHSFWTQQFGAARDIVGRTLLLGGTAHTVIGVMPQGFGFPSAGVDLWAPMGGSHGPQYWQDRGRHNLMVIGRLKAGVSLAQANEDLVRISERLQRAYPDTNRELGAFAVPLAEHVTRGVRPLYLLLLASAGLLLLLTCANLASLLLARMVRQGHEIAIRLALGGSRWRIWRQSLLENALLGVAGGMGGLLLAWWTLDVLQPLLPREFAAVAPLSLDHRAFVFALVTSLAAGLLISCMPWLQLRRLDPNEALQSGRRSGLGRYTHRAQGALVVAQLTLCTILLIGAGLLVRTFARLQRAELGFRPDQVTLVRFSAVALWSDKYSNPAQRVALSRELRRRLSALPGVTAVGLTSGAPLVMKYNMTSIWPEGREAGAGTPPVSVNDRAITPGYLAAIGTSLRAGRNLGEFDGPDTPPVALVNETLARQFWPGQNAVGRRFRRGGTDGPLITVVGIVADMHQAGVDAPARAEMYLAANQTGGVTPDLVLRTDGTAAVGAQLRREIAAVDPGLPIVDLRPMADVVAWETSPRRLQARLLGALAGLALLIAAVGLYGTMSQVVESRTREIGVRTALGASPRDIATGVLQRALGVAAGSIAAGIMLALLFGQALAGLLYGVQPRDPLSIATAAALVLGVAVLAAWLPARRAMRVDPIEALRAE